ncbi:MAG: DUF2304 domain-containing protein, partial [Anaerolineae bacterium]|nr:DUF2304 domain-containing protein [Anaerolineae bacterium]
LLGILFQFSLRISRFSDQIKVLAQEIALLRHELETIRQGTSDEVKHVEQG